MWLARWTAGRAAGNRGCSASCPSIQVCLLHLPILLVAAAVAALFLLLLLLLLAVCCRGCTCCHHIALPLLLLLGLLLLLQRRRQGAGRAGQVLIVDLCGKRSASADPPSCSRPAGGQHTPAFNLPHQPGKPGTQPTAVQSTHCNRTHLLLVALRPLLGRPLLIRFPQLLLCHNTQHPHVAASGRRVGSSRCAVTVAARPLLHRRFLHCWK